MPAPRGNKRAVGNRGGVGGPEVYLPRFARVAERLARFGATDVEIADALGIVEKTLYLWKHKHPEFATALKRGKFDADMEVIDSLFQRAKGYSHPDVHVTTIDGVVTMTPIVKHYPPDTTAAIYWTKNRRPDDWREKSTVEVTGDLSDRLEAAFRRVQD